MNLMGKEEEILSWVKMGTRDKVEMGEAEGSDYVLNMLYESLRELVHMLFQKWEFLFFWRDNTYKRMEFS